jgi:carboxylate-amine ligase
VGDSQKLTPEEQIALCREQFENGTDFTLAVEEEFALLDPETLTMVNRFEEIVEAAAGSALEPHLAGELIASEAEVKTGRCETFAEAAALLPERRLQLLAVTDILGMELASIGTHPWASWKDQRIIDTPHYRRNDEILKYVVWRNNTFGLHVHVGIRGVERAIKVCNALRNHLPTLLALSASSPFVEDIFTHLHSARTQLFTKMFPRCGIPDTFADWAEFESYVRLLYDTHSIDEHTQLWWSVRPHLAFPTVEIRICDAQPSAEESVALSALIYALTARLARAVDEGEPLVWQPRRLLEENFWRAIRRGLDGELIDLQRGVVVPTRQAVEELVAYVLPVAEEIGAAPFLCVPERNSAQRQMALYADGVSAREIYTEIVRAMRPVSRV